MSDKVETIRSSSSGVLGRARNVARGVTGVRLLGAPPDALTEGVRTAVEPNRFAHVSMTFELAGVNQTQAEALVETYRQR